MTNKIPSGTEKHHKSTEQESSKTAKMFSFFLSSDGLAQWCMNFSWWFTYETASFFQSSAQPHHFFTTLKSRKALAATRLKT